MSFPISEAMLECALCGIRKQLEVGLSAERELRETGAIRLSCEECSRETYWFYARDKIRSLPPALGVSTKQIWGAAMERRTSTERRQRPRRAQRRVALEIPVRIRAQSAEAQFEEVARTVNVSHSGIYVRSESSSSTYSNGLPVSLAMNYTDAQSGPAFEQQGLVVRVDALPGFAAKGVAVRIL